MFDILFNVSNLIIHFINMFDILFNVSNPIINFIIDDYPTDMQTTFWLYLGISGINIYIKCYSRGDSQLKSIMLLLLSSLIELIPAFFYAILWPLFLLNTFIAGYDLKSPFNVGLRMLQEKTFFGSGMYSENGRSIWFAWPNLTNHYIKEW